MFMLAASASFLILAQAAAPGSGTSGSGTSGSAASGAASAPASSPASAAPAATSAGAKVTCRSEIETGSNFPKKTCHTASEWAQLANDSRESVQKMQQNNGYTH